MIQTDIFNGILDGKFINVNSDDGSCPLHTSQNTQYSRTTPHIEHRTTGKIRCQYRLQHESGSFVMARPKSHLRVYQHIVTSLRNIGMKCTMYHALFTHDNRFEIIFLPFFVPIPPGNECRFIRHRYPSDGILRQLFFKSYLVILSLRDKSSNPSFVGDKTFITDFSQNRSQNICRHLATRLYIEPYLHIVIHNCTSFQIIVFVALLSEPEDNSYFLQIHTQDISP